MKKLRKRLRSKSLKKRQNRFKKHEKVIKNDLKIEIDEEELLNCYEL